MYSRRLNTERLDRHRDDRMQRLDRDRLDMKVNKHKKNTNREPYLKNTEALKNTTFSNYNKNYLILSKQQISAESQLINS